MAKYGADKGKLTADGVFARSARTARPVVRLSGPARSSSSPGRPGTSSCSFATTATGARRRSSGASSSARSPTTRRVCRRCRRVRSRATTTSSRRTSRRSRSRRASRCSTDRRSTSLTSRSISQSSRSTTPRPQGVRLRSRPGQRRALVLRRPGDRGQRVPAPGGVRLLEPASRSTRTTRRRRRPSSSRPASRSRWRSSSGIRRTSLARTCPIRSGTSRPSQASLEKSGFKVVPKSAPWRPDYLGEADSGTAGAAYLLGWTGDYADPESFLGGILRAEKQFGIDNAVGKSVRRPRQGACPSEPQCPRGDLQERSTTTS